MHTWQKGSVGVVPNSLQDIGRASDGAKRRPVEAEGWAYLESVFTALNTATCVHREIVVHMTIEGPGRGAW
jgi:hypothetical protein